MEWKKVIVNQYSKDGTSLRKIRSFVRREGRLTKAQKNAIEECWPRMGIDYQQENLDWKKIFGNENPVILEIGFGMGASLVEMAKKSPEKNFVGIEVYTPGVGACLALARNSNITNLYVIYHDALEVFEHMVPDDSLNKLQLFFPDPWFKVRHHKRRIIKVEFVEIFRTKLQIGIGTFHVVTDWKNYAENIVKVMNFVSGFENVSEHRDYIPRPDDRPITKFEARAYCLGQEIWDMKYRRTA
ncbi:tRNA (guanosine(46)-N7)-methyltransferase TrmB [Candidatus Photodesmus blepharus]|uniref:tRNA (guanosine(46)-N7)-methyltransferase TrmB n=1 Tax=Candidatus Photodesmus blepharonis TaxID=1179155 RepID=UPI00054E1DBA|nr:tRNA (guanosine(46)-N7)-methyltransferase TrmB [Candidatus Photodesmus blepharus]